MLSLGLKGLLYQVAEEECSFSGLLIEAQVLVESGGNPGAVSRADALGLMQIMPRTAKGMGVNPDQLFDPEVNLRAGIRYLVWLYGKFPEIPLPYYRMNCALAAYNGGRFWVNKALKLARQACGVKDRTKVGAWQSWEVAGPYLAHPKCRNWRRRRPDATQILLYVAKVRATFDRLNRGIS